MQYRSGDNRHEPLSDEAKSNSWKFLIRDVYDPSLPAAFAPYVNFVAWIATAKTTNRWLIRGFIQFKNRRTYRTLKVRYSKKAEWIPVTASDIRIYNEFVMDPLPKNSRRFQIGVPLGQPNSILPNKLPVYGMSYNGPDLIEDFEAFHASEEAKFNPEPDPVEWVPDPSPPPIPLPKDEYFYHDDGSFYAAYIKGNLYFDMHEIPLSDEPLDD